MENKSAKVVIIDKRDNPLSKRLIKNTCSDLKIPHKELYLTWIRSCSQTKLQQKFLFNEIESIDPSFVITLGKEPTYVTLYPMLSKAFNLSEYVGDIMDGKWYTIPTYDSYRIMNGTKKELNQFKSCFQTIRNELFGD